MFRQPRHGLDDRPSGGIVSCWRLSYKGCEGQRCSDTESHERLGGAIGCMAEAEAELLSNEAEADAEAVCVVSVRGTSPRRDS